MTVIIVAALSALGALGHHAVARWAQGIEGVRLGEFAEVAEQIRQDVKRKLDVFIEAEQQRQWTDYLYYYVPENVVAIQQQLPVLRSPLSEQFSNSFAYDYFQVEPGGASSRRTLRACRCRREFKTTSWPGRSNRSSRT